MQINTAAQALEFLKSAGRAEEAELNLFLCALAFDKVRDPDLDTQKYVAAVEGVVGALKSKAKAQGEPADAQVQQALLSSTLHDDFGFSGNEAAYEDVSNAEIHKVIDTRLGLPVSLGILYIHVARELDWDAYGLNFPGHFLMALEGGGQKIFMDPFRGGRNVDASDMRQILKVLAGQQAELSHDYYQRLADQDILIRLQNNLKTGLIDMQDYKGALMVTDSMRVFAPDEYRLLFDSAILKVKTEQFQSARDDIKGYIKSAPTPKERMGGEQLLYEIERALN